MGPILDWLRGKKRVSVAWASAEDQEMLRAQDEARRTFRYFWREQSWDRRRGFPAIEFAAVKLPFRDTKTGVGSAGSMCEEMWIGDVTFDGKSIEGILVNEPDYLKSVRQGDRAAAALRDVSDWVYVTGGRVYGGFTVDVLRGRMTARARAAHDDGWDLNFGHPVADPAAVPTVPLEVLDATDEDRDEHPADVAMSLSLPSALQTDPRLLTRRDEHGLSLLHEMALAGARKVVGILVANGADISANAKNGLRAIEMAQALGWERVVRALASSSVG